MQGRGSMDTGSAFLRANTDILERCAESGVIVLRNPLDDPDDADLKLVCEYFRETDTQPANYGLYVQIERTTGKIGACTVPYYKEFFEGEPILQRHLRNFDTARTDQELYEHSLRLFHALLSLASPEIAGLVIADYKLGELFEAAEAPTNQQRQSVVQKLGGYSGKLLEDIKGRVDKLSRLPGYLDKTFAQVSAQLHSPAMYSLLTTAPDLANPPDRASLPDVFGQVEDALGKPTTMISESETKQELWLFLLVGWNSPDIAPATKVHIIISTTEPPPPDLPWAEDARWVFNQIWAGPTERADAWLELRLLRSDAQLPPQQIVAATEWAKSLRISITKEG